MKVMRVVGARPQLMQVPLLYKALITRGHSHLLVHTGQHYDANMNALFFKEFNLPEAEINLGISSLSHGAMTGRMMEGIEAVLQKEQPDVVVVDGDTNSTMAAALAAAKLDVPVVHIEAGIRDFNCRRPEEINRVVTDHVATLNCAPIPRALDNLHREGLAASSFLSGDLLLDNYLFYFEQRNQHILHDLKLTSGAYHLATLHRPENTDQEKNSRFTDIISFLADLDKPVVLPCHPRTRQQFAAYQAQGGKLGAILLIDPVGYLEMLALLEGADYVFTDSGGLLREAAWSGRRCIMLLKEDSFYDLLEQKWAIIAKSNRESIEEAYAQPCSPDALGAQKLFGGGGATAAIVKAMEAHF